ncbi:GIY-YIG nuclease family protein [Rhizobium alvei]|uniref:GIY-YIG nuclease family protein n=1 Tax=Rhizobium alvei TaxID=1132659 RepID=A0ABT8YU04_9HYPH|nr:GIY-YIG nuclease family protein [Rhizobium alvei]MDO6966990.1 GIY-YIG nuclease family protein [Rhizobium alvei]
MSYLYIIAHPLGWRKVGRANDPIRRLRQHQGHSGYPLVGEAIFPCDDATIAERRALSSLHSFRIMGEWFNITFDQALAAVSKATGSEAKPFPSLAISSCISAGDEYTTSAMIRRIQDRLGLATETSVYDLLSDDLKPWVDELRQRDIDRGKVPFEPDDKWIAYVKGSMKQTADTRRRNASP